MSEHTKIDKLKISLDKKGKVAKFYKDKYQEVLKHSNISDLVLSFENKINELNSVIFDLETQIKELTEDNKNLTIELAEVIFIFGDK